MKLSVAPESTRTCLLAFVCELCKSVGIRNDRYLLENMLLSPNARAQAAGSAHPKNPPQYQLPSPY